MPKEPLKSGKILKLKPTMEEEFASFLGEIQWLEQTIQDQHTAYYHLRETRFRGTLIKRNRRLLENLKTLQEIHRLMPTSRKDRLFRLVHKGLVLEPLEPMELNEKSMPVKSSKTNARSPLTPAGDKDTSQAVFKVINPVSENPPSEGSSPIPLPSGKLRGDVLDIVMDGVTWEWLAQLNALLPKIMTLETATEIEALKGTHIEANRHLFDNLLLQRCVFRTADLIDRHRLVPPGHLESFLQLKDTLPFASITVHESEKILSVKDYWYQSGFSRFRYSKKFVDLVDKVAENREPV
ncbi:hypothetical protein MJO28_008502 [Puccinia striiformis f. sp. tritici]|uniref:Uncharacterized protein n=2 Tax=Puccinia striiformis f. sp. tritici TaxID=168172 RepID=A0A0L0VG10_9BASI|nr:hypothetical protein Pst134EA_015431 [Puccinia striiformis f. sp. tritici]KNE98235.1 hypothetical protein PSTG_08505 [Puccinia striiformis f. sp. tritici PST-78]KAH9452591.1 hypothetical protein Pst134EB_016542 [Puccinia striiformis f. sp. tritici]KAH9463348.1 hypothetical protein Pst134EA_015431 [Puccinia striiformis f. sp. tritici]KAI7949681.1 hypothetical protein MJO28_008502 [Puccinia striiformis f. sp. tritici]KAI7952764.1 hypothetical protein MJO29_008395 [Puccinia striiformis f. sp. 